MAYFIDEEASFFGSSNTADLMSGSDGPLSIDGTTVEIPAGSIKRYSSISIINGGSLVIQGADTYLGANPGHLPTLIGCAGNCTIDGTSTVQATDNAGSQEHFYGDIVYSAPVVPFDAVLSTIQYTRYGQWGGSGGEAASYGTIIGNDIETGNGPTGHGGGGAGYADGGNCTMVEAWGECGIGAESINQPDTGYIYPLGSGFGANGVPGFGGEIGTGLSVGGGGSGGLRGYSGGAIFLQIAGTANIAANTFQVSGSSGGNGGDGGVAGTPDGDAYGGGGGGGGAGGGGGYVWIYYKTGTVSASAAIVTAGLGGLGGVGGLATGGLSSNVGLDGQQGADGFAGGSTIATY